MTKFALAPIIDLLRRNSGRWVPLDEDITRGALNAKRGSWTYRTPCAFVGQRFEFRTTLDRYSDKPHYLLEGRHVHTTFDLETGEVHSLAPLPRPKPARDTPTPNH